MMLRLASLWILLITFIYADGFKTCQQKLLKSYTLIENKPAIYTDKGWLVFSSTPLKHYTKSEPLLGLYVVKNSLKLSPFKVINRFPKEVASITPQTIMPNRITQEASGMDRLACLNSEAEMGEAVFGKCCTIRGFVSAKGVVTADLIYPFLYGGKKFSTAGVRFTDKKKKIYVAQKNPFFAYNALHIGDEVIAFNGKAYGVDELNKKILLTPVGTKVTFSIKRNGDRLLIPIYTKRKLGGGVLADTFLEHLGLRFDDKLAIVLMDNKSMGKKMECKVGDRLIAINGVTLKDENHLRNYFSHKSLGPVMDLLFERDGLQFFVHMSTKHKLKLN